MTTAPPPDAADRFRRVDAIFDAALDLPAEEQAAFVERECAGDDALRAEVLGLIRAYHRADLLEAPAARVAAPLLDAATAATGPVPERIGAFRVVREIGRGGMGRVFLGERADAEFEQRVAIKLILDGAPGVLRRFLEERRILARLEHPGIARLVDGGLTPGGLPYFAMELVEGEPIDRWCAARDLSLDARLDLFGRVCDAVSFAHHHLVIHRDLKPSNILVTAAGDVKLLDFGIAKLLGPSAEADLTRTGLSAMTPEFAAPEQIRGQPVGTATDVYALGVLLYHLLTGERPYDLTGRTAAEVERIVCEEEPPRASTRAPAAWRRALRGDLDLIVATALQKEERRRYQTPAELAGDLRRWRQGHPIHARPDRAGYRLRKFIGRHRAAVVAGALTFAGLVAAVSRETVLRGRAEAEARKAKEVEQYLVRVFNVADPNAWDEPDGGKMTARELLDRGARRIDSTLAGQPETQAELRGVLGRVYTSLGLYAEATPLLERTVAQRTGLFGPDDERVAESLDLLGVALTQQSRYDEAEPLLRRGLELRRRRFGASHLATAESLEHLATLLEERGRFDDAEPLYREVLAVRRSLAGDSTVEVANAIGNLGLLLHRKGAFAEAESLHRRALGIDLGLLGEQHPLTSASMQNLAQTLQILGRLEEALALQRRALEAKRKALGDAHPSVTLSKNNLANLLARQLDRPDEGEALAREALAGDRQTFGDSHTYVAASLLNLGIILRLQGRLAEADTTLRQALAMNRRLFKGHHERIASNLNALALTRYAMGDGPGAIDYMRRSLAEYRLTVGDAHRATTTTLGGLGLVLAEYGDPVEAESLARASLGRLDSTRAEHRGQRITGELALGKALLARRRADSAVVVLEHLVGLAQRAFGVGNWRTGDALLTYGQALVAAGRQAEGREALVAARAALAQNARAQPRLLARADLALRSLPRAASP